MLKLLYDVRNGKWYDESGDALSHSQPFIPYGSTERVVIQFHKYAFEGFGDLTKYTGFAGISDIGAILATDNNFHHWFTGSLGTPIAAGTVAENTAIDITTDAGIDDIAESGNLYLYADGMISEAVAYASRTAISGGIRFFAAAGNTLTHSYDAEAPVDLPEMLYAEAAMVATNPNDPTASDPATGRFAFDFVCDSVKLRNKLKYTSIERLDDCKGLEITIYRAMEDSTFAILKRFRCPTFRIVKGIADFRSGVPLAKPEVNQFLALMRDHLFIPTGTPIHAVPVVSHEEEHDTATVEWKNGCIYEVAIPEAAVVDVVLEPPENVSGVSTFELHIVQHGGNLNLFGTMRWYDPDDGFTNPDTPPPNLSQSGRRYVLVLRYHNGVYYANLGYPALEGSFPSAE